MVGGDPLAAAVDPRARVEPGLVRRRLPVVAALLGRGVDEDGEVVVNLHELDVGEGVFGQVVLLDKVERLRLVVESVVGHLDEVVGQHAAEGVPVLRLDRVPDLPLLGLEVGLRDAGGRGRRGGAGVRVGVSVRPLVRVCGGGAGRRR